MTANLMSVALLVVLSMSGAGSQTAAETQNRSHPKSQASGKPNSAQPPYQHQETWYEFTLRQFNPQNINYGVWIEERRRELIEARAKSPYFLYSLCASMALLMMIVVCVKLRIDHRRAMWITAEMMADIYNQDAYSRHIAQEAIERYNQHIERCNRAIELGESGVTNSSIGNEIGQLRTELMRVAEERDTAIRERDVAQEDVRKKSEILADMSVRLEALTNKTAATSVSKSFSDVRGADSKLISHINNLQEQLYAERSVNRRLRGG